MLLPKHLLSALLLFTLSAGAQQPALRLDAIPFPLQWENQPRSYNITKDGITIEAGAKTDMFRDPNVTYNTDNAPKLLFRPDSNFVLTVGIQHAFRSKWDGGAIVLKQDSLNWIKFCFEKDYTGARRVVSVVTNNISDDCNSVEAASDKAFYKIAKAGNVITLYYSPDNANWLLVRHLQFNATKAIYVGFLAQSPEGSSCTVAFSNIRYSNKKIQDPYKGE